MQSILMFALMGLAATAMACFLLLIILYTRNEKRERLRLEQTKADIADMAILFQTMRDVITQQKNLARDFNQELEKKVSQVKQVLAQSMGKNERLYEQQQALAKQLQEAQAQLESLQRQMNYLRDAVNAVAKGAALPAPPPAPAPPRSESRLPPAAADGRPSVQDTMRPVQPAAPPIAEPETSRPVEARIQEKAEPRSVSPRTQTAFADWTGFGAEEAHAEAQPRQAVERPRALAEDTDSARAAFHALLDLAPPQRFTPSPAQVPTPFPEVRDNGGRTSAALQQRVLEYSEAGMTVPEIARELGIGKGEVRLMLSLAKQKRH